MNPNSAINLSKTYSDLLCKAEDDRAFLLAHIESIPKEKIDTLLENAERDINYFRLRVQHVSSCIQAPNIPWVLPEMPVVPNMGSPSKEPGNLSLPPEIPVVIEVKTQEPDSSLAWLGVAVVGFMAVPFIMKAAADNPGATRQLLHQLAILFHSDEV